MEPTRHRGHHLGMLRVANDLHRRLAPEELARRYAVTRDRRDLDPAFQAFEPLARGLASRYRRTSVPREDLRQAAFLGLLKALQRFDPARGCAFTTFAVPTILGEIRRQCREAIWPAHVPRPVRERVRLLRDATDRMSGELRRSPTVAELAARLGWDNELVVDALFATNTLASVSLDPHDGSDHDQTSGVADRIGAEDPGYDFVECRADIEQALPSLEDQERSVLRLRFADERTLTQIGAELGVAPSHAARLLQGALDRLSSLSGQRDLPLVA
jgi:RNA polymerase sigma-B factor